MTAHALHMNPIPLRRKRTVPRTGKISHLPWFSLRTRVSRGGTREKTRRGEEGGGRFCRRCINSADFACTVSWTPGIWGKKGRTGLPRFFFVRRTLCSVVVCLLIHRLYPRSPSSRVWFLRRNRRIDYNYLRIIFLDVTSYFSRREKHICSCILKYPYTLHAKMLLDFSKTAYKVFTRLRFTQSQRNPGGYVKIVCSPSSVTRTRNFPRRSSKEDDIFVATWFEIDRVGRRYRGDERP